MNFKTPKYIQKILENFHECFKVNNRVKGNCIKCFDIISFSILYMEENNLVIPKNTTYYISGIDTKTTAVSKLFRYCISNRTCKYGINEILAWKFFKWILHLTLEEKEQFRKRLLAHIEIKDIDRNSERGISIYDKKLKIYKEI